ncbi:pentatricopeptide repeat-containing protein At1g11290, chloroplastic-like isoform X2 [Selaginella moellendorffii]|uniref:pentatricopeptide repeat-containing protein At1g11290, chloroplastic-like isoform X2 n=1 Tax=Selaginella moellendorffii TaxID=88036 RepID=UPI000D1C59F3|nr:pentatricopeptide repeat-containing protein At1g11290, chloroplastic-like isoform X2 [Selaginella moellendorffii]|eukprot:XP_024521811.1 pentatricopeptide repeat-containing protein At1g11290, chloroplastic-like isoform X2 [Selaginella moellendorffii]
MTELRFVASCLPKRTTNAAPLDGEVLTRYSKLQVEGEKLEVTFLLTALKSCRKLKDLEFSKRIHRDAVASGDISNVFVANTLLDMYVKSGSLDTARSLFEGMKQRSAVSWTAMIVGYTQIGRPELALELYDRMQNEGCEPDRVTLLAALKACAAFAKKEKGQLLDQKVVRLKCLATASRLYSQACQGGDQMDTAVGNSLIDLFAKCGSLEDARRQFESMPKRNVVSWNCIILGYALGGEGRIALEFFARMQEQGYQPSDVTFLAALKACASMADKEEGKLVEGKILKVTSLDRGRLIHFQALRNGGSLGLALGTSFVDVFAKCGSMVEARKIFEELQTRSMVSWTVMILGYVQNGEPDTALRLFARMWDERCAPDGLAFVAALKACASLAETEEAKLVGGRLVKSVALERGRAIHSQAAGAGLVDLVVANTLIDMYAKCGSIWDARHVFEAMKKRSAVSWNCILMGCVHNGEAELALELYRRMQRQQSSLSSPPPDAVTFVAALKACATLAALEVGTQIEAEICNAGLECELMVANSLVDLYGKCGAMGEAERVFSSVPRKDVVTWSCLIAGYSSRGDALLVFELFERMQVEDKLQPDGLASRAKEYFVSMQAVYGITPSIEHYNCVVDLLGRVGQLQDAVEIARSMPYDPGAVVWMALLDAAEKWSDPEVGRTAYEFLVERGRSSKAAGAASAIMAKIQAHAGKLSKDSFLK